MPYFSVSGSLDLHFIKQWQVTLIIIDLTLFVLRVVLLLAKTELDHALAPLIYSTVFGFLLYVYCKDYMEDYVNLSKI